MDDKKFNSHAQLHNQTKKEFGEPHMDGNNSSYQVKPETSPADKLKENIAYIQAQGLSSELEAKAIQIAESGMGSVNIDFNSNEPQIMVNTVFNKTYNSEDLIVDAGRVIPAEWGMSATEFNGDYMGTYADKFLFKEINSSPVVKNTEDALIHEPTTTMEEFKSSIGVTRQVVGSNDSIDGQELRYEDPSGRTNLVDDLEGAFNVAKNNHEIILPYSKAKQDEDIQISGESAALSHTKNENAVFQTVEEIESAIERKLEAAQTNIVETLLNEGDTGRIINSTELNGCSNDLNPDKYDVTSNNVFDKIEEAMNTKVVADILPVTDIDPKPAGTNPLNGIDPTEFFNVDGSLKADFLEKINMEIEKTLSSGDAPSGTKPHDRVDATGTLGDAGTPPEAPFDPTGGNPPNDPEIKEALNEKQVLRQFKGHSTGDVLQYFVTIEKAAFRLAKNTMIQGDESAELESAKNVANVARDVFSYCDMVAGSSARDILVTKELVANQITNDVKHMIDNKTISFDDLTGDKGVAGKLREKGVRERQITAILAHRQQILTNLKAQEILYEFATKSNKFTPEQMALLKNDTFFNAIDFATGKNGANSICSAYFRNCENEMLRKMDPTILSRKDLLRFDKNVQKAERLYQRSLSTVDGKRLLTVDEKAFIEAYRLKDNDKVVYDLVKNRKLARTDGKGRDKIARVKGLARKRMKFFARKMDRAGRKMAQASAEGKMVMTLRAAANSVKTGAKVAFAVGDVSWKLTKGGAKVTWFVSKPIRSAANKYIVQPAVQAVKDFIATEKVNVQQSAWYQEKKRQLDEKRKQYENSEKGKKRAEEKKQRDTKKAANAEKKEAKNKDKRAKKEKKATKKNARKDKLGKIGKVVGLPMKIVTFPFKSAEELMALVVAKLKSMLIIPALKVLIILLPILYVLALLSGTGGGENPLNTLYNEYIIVGNDEADGVNYVYKWNEMMEGWQAGIDDAIHDLAVTKPHTCNDYRIFGEDYTCSVCGAFILGQEAATSTDAEGLKNEEVYYDTKIYAYGSPKSYDDPTASWYHNANATIDPDKLNGYRIYYLDAKGNVIASSTTNIKDLLCLMTVWRENYFLTNDFDDMSGEENLNKVDKMVKKSLEWLWDRFKPVVSTQVSAVYHTEYSTDKFPKNGSTYDCTDKNFYKKYNEAVADGVMMYDTVAPQQTTTPSVNGYICSGKGCKYTETWKWSTYTICGKTEHTHVWGCNSNACSHVCNKNEGGACATRCTHNHTRACCSKSYHSHSTSNGCYKKIYYREYFCDGNHPPLHCSYGYRDLNIYVTTFKIADIIQLRAADEIASQDYITFTNTLLNKKLGAFESNKFYNFAGFPYTFFLDNSDGSRFTNRLEWSGDAFLYFYVPQNFTRNDVEFKNSLKAYQKTVNLKDAYDKGYISQRFFYESVANLTEAAIDEGYDGFNCFDYERHKEMTDMYGLESNMGFKICPDAELNSAAREEKGISDKGCTGTIEWLFRLYTADWMAAYGIDSYGITSLEGNNTLDEDEIQDFLLQIDNLYTGTESLSYQRKDMVYRVLNTVGKIPYWSGGQPTSQIYNSRWGRTAEETDPNYEENIAAGRTSFGLDAMGYFRYIYWSTVYRQPNYTPSSFYATSGIREVSYTDLRPGDIGFINPPTAEFNVIGIFVGFQDGVAKWVYMDKAAGTVVLTNGGSVSGSGTQGSFAYFYSFLN